MYNLLIVDDESEIADSLHELFQSIKEPELIVYKCYSARTALELMSRIKVDLVLTDIRMPGMNGLSLVERIKENWPQCRAIFLTGYSEFDYAYSAIQNRGTRFLLKTEGDDKIIGAVQDTIREMESNLKSAHLVNLARNHLERTLPLLRRQLFQDILNGDVAAEEISKEKWNELQLSISGTEKLHLLVGRLDRVSSRQNSPEKKHLLFSLQTIVSSYLPASHVVVQLDMERSYAVWVLRGRDDTFMGQLECAQDACRVSLEATVSFALSDEPVELGELAETYDRLKRVLSIRDGSAKEMIVSERSFATGQEASVEDNVRPDLRAAYKKLNRLKLLGACLESGQKTEAAALLGEMIEGLREVNSKFSPLATEIYLSVSLVFLNYMNRRSLGERLAGCVDFERLIRIDGFADWSDAVDFLYDLAEKLLKLETETKEMKVIHSITIIQEYIQSHLSEDISLVRLADEFNFNASYLSRLFKEVTGQNLTEYIGHRRVDKAKKLLAINSLKVGEVSKEVGYGSPHSFARFFRNEVGMSPQEFRDSVLKKS